MDTSAWRIGVLGALVLVALAFGLWRRRRDGRVHAVEAALGVTAVEVGLTALGERATLVQISSSLCAPCRAARRILAAVAAGADGVLHVELDAERHLDLVRRFDVTRTPSVLVLDGGGTVVGRSAGVPTVEVVLQALPTTSRRRVVDQGRRTATARPGR
jgi:thiol-disulfide isomerase/thioredoxin